MRSGLSQTRMPKSEPNTLHVAHALDALQFVDDVDVAVVADEERVVGSIRRVEREVQQGIGRLLAHRHARR